MHRGKPPGRTVPAADLTGTPGAHTIEEVCQLLHLPREKACKAVAYEKETDGGLVLLFCGATWK